MFHLVVTACLAADPGICAARLLPAGDASRREDCLMRGDEIARDWIARHASLKAKGTPDCLPTEALPALDVTEVADDTWVHIGKTEALSEANQGRIANLGFIIGDTVAVIDAGGSRAEGEAFYAAIRRQTDLPVSHLILTHMHPDHIFGAEVFSEAGATIIANARLPEGVALRQESWMQSIPAQIGTEAMLGTKISAFDQLIDKPSRISLGDRELELTPARTAHTDNDLTLHDLGSGVFFAGDLIFLDLAPVIDGSLTGWLGWLSAPAPDPTPSLIVPGHGPIQHSWEAATGPERAYLEALETAVKGLIESGSALSAAIPQTVSALAPLRGGWTDFDAATARNAATAFSELEWQ